MRSSLAGEKARALAIFLIRWGANFKGNLQIRGAPSDRTSAFRYLEEAYHQRVFRIIELTLPMFDSLRSDPRWGDLVRRIGLPQ